MIQFGTGGWRAVIGSDFIEKNICLVTEGICALMESCALSQEQAARVLGKSQSAIANKLRLLRHSPPVLEALRKASLTERHARALLKLPSETQKLTVISVIARQELSVAQTEKYIAQLLEDPKEPAKKVQVHTFLNHLTQSLQKIQLSGIPAVSERKETDRQIVLTITIPK